MKVRETKLVHTGQYHPYGDAFTVWEVYTEEPMAEFQEVLDWCRENLVKDDLPLESDAMERWRAKTMSWSEYFSGWLRLERPEEKKWVFTHVRPYAD